MDLSSTAKEGALVVTVNEQRIDAAVAIQFNSKTKCAKKPKAPKTASF
ncbi:hypothetical protein SAMN05444000_101114 [Shimia gijangensis]|uniref:Uncharacterized protein n=1 Tax=Shimia gijangensis TaxID=1470563 RepID=A0A1M6B397_9RHOB|nr:hypothetical protein SAMN05444000_101114 [Shimia gijangensis]